MANSPYIRNQQARFERLLLQQLLARRFSLEQPKLFGQVKHLLLEVEAQFDTPNLRGTPPFFSRDRALTWISAWLGLLGFPGGRKALLERDTRKIGFYLGNEMLADTAPDSLLERATTYVPLLEHFDREFNYLEYCGLFPVAALCPGEQLAFDFLKHSATPLPQLSVTVDGYTDQKVFRWFYRGRDCSPDVQTAIFLSVHPWRFTSENSTIALYRAEDHNPNSRFLGDRNAVCLIVYLDRAPRDIDSALRALRQQLEDELNEEHQGLVPDMRTYLDTDFAQAVNRESVVFGQNQMLWPALLGLWCWDIVRGSEVGDGTSVYSARLRIQDHLDRSGIGSSVPNLQHLEKHFRKIQDLVESTQPGMLDHVLAQSSKVRLGLRIR